MAAYITYAQYTEMYGTPIISEDEFKVYAAQASALIDTITQYRIPQCGGLSALPEWVQDAVRNAVGAQVLYFSELGLETVLTGQTGQSFTVGKVSVSGGGLSSGNKTGAQLMISPLAEALLEQTGLMYRGVNVCSDLFHGPYWWI